MTTINASATFTTPVAGMPAHPLERCRVDHDIVNNATYTGHILEPRSSMNVFWLFDREEKISIYMTCYSINPSEYNFVIILEYPGHSTLQTRWCNNLHLIRDCLVDMGLVEYCYLESFKWIETNLSNMAAIFNQTERPA